MCYDICMSKDIVFENMNLAYANIISSIGDAKKVAIEYEVLMSQIEHKEGKGISVNNVDEYFVSLA